MIKWIYFEMPFSGRKERGLEICMIRGQKLENLLWPTLKCRNLLVKIVTISTSLLCEIVRCSRVKKTKITQRVSSKKVKLLEARVYSVKPRSCCDLTGLIIRQLDYVCWQNLLLFGTGCLERVIGNSMIWSNLTCCMHRFHELQAA